MTVPPVKPTAQPKRKVAVGDICSLPDDLWPDLGYESMESFGITKWTIAFTPKNVISADVLFTGVVDGVMAPWANALVVRAKTRLQGAKYACELLWRVSAVGESPPSRELVKAAWANLASWVYDLLAGPAYSLQLWLERAVKPSSQCYLKRNAWSLRRLHAVLSLEKHQDDAVALFHAQGELSSDRVVARYSPQIVANRLDQWWGKDMQARTELTSVRHRNIG